MARYPRARKDDLIVEPLDDELLIYDQARDVACRLNGTAARIWEACDGTRTVGDLVDVLSEDLDELADEDLVLLTLDYLSEQRLLESGYTRRDEASSQLSRRRFIQRVGAVGVAAAALPMVHSIVAPTPADAMSVVTGY